MKAYIHSKDAITPQCLEIMGEVKRRAVGDVPIEFDDLPEHPPRGCTVFALGTFKPTEAVGRVVPAPSVAQICTSPETVTRLGQAFRLLVEPPVLPAYRYTVLYDIHAAEKLLAQRGQMFAVDLEWSGVNDRPAYERILCVGIYDGVRAYVIPEELVPALRDELTAFLEGNGIITVNGKGDLSYFPEAHVAPEDHFDCMLAHYALFPAAAEHGLKPITKRMFGFEDWDADKEQYLPAATYEEREVLEDGSWHDARAYPRKNGKGSGYERIPRGILYEYNGFDVYATWHWFLSLREMLAADPDAMRVFRHLMRLSNLFMGVEGRGYRLDIPYLEELSEALHAEQDAAEAKLDEIVGMTTNPRSPKQVKERFSEEYGVALPSTDEKTLTEFIEDYAPDPDEAPGRSAADFARQILMCRGIAKTLGTYVDGYRAQADEDGYVYPGYKLHASTTGRLGGRGASMLTIPREKRLKKMVLPDEGHVMVGADLSQAELRVMAVESADPWLIEAFQPGAGDFFDRLLGQAYPATDWVDLHRRVSEHAASEDEANRYNGTRAKMKGVVYGVSFGRGTKAIAASLKIATGEAQRLVDAFIRPGSPFDLWRTDISTRAITGKPIVSRFGRHFQSELVTHRNRQNVINSALSFTSQSTANDICLLATLEVEPQLAAHGYRLVGTVHDAIYVSGPEQGAETVGKLLCDSLAWAGREVYGPVVPFDADWGYGASMADV